jgi:hypothetical protein
MTGDATNGSSPAAADASGGRDMESQENESGGAPALRLVPRSKAKVFAGAVAVVATSSFAFLVFGPLADQRVLALAGYDEPVVAAAARGPVVPRSEARIARTGPAALELPL